MSEARPVERPDALRLTRGQRQEIVAMIPWVTPLKRPWPCDGIKWGTVALRDIWSIRGRPPRGIQPRSRCRKTARWSFKGLGSERRGTRKLCWDHLISQGLYGSMAEERRAQRWFAAHEAEVASVESGDRAV